MPSRRIDKGERRAFLDHLQRQVFAAIGRDRAFALRHLFRRVGGRLHLHDLLLSELLQIVPAEIAADLIGHGHDRAAIAGMRLDDLAFPFRVEQIGKAFRRVLGLDELRVVLDRRQREAVGGVKPVRVAIVGRIFRDIGRARRREPALLSSRRTAPSCPSIRRRRRHGCCCCAPARCAGRCARSRCARPARRCRDAPPRRPWRSSPPSATRSRCSRRFSPRSFALASSRGLSRSAAAPRREAVPAASSSAIAPKTPPISDRFIRLALSRPYGNGR